MAPKPIDLPTPGAVTPSVAEELAASPLGQQRRFARFGEALRMEYDLNGQAGSGFTSDISSGGFLLRGAKGFTLAQTIHFKLVLPAADAPVEIDAVVRRIGTVGNEAGVGFEFLPGQDAARQQIIAHIETQDLIKLERAVSRHPNDGAKAIHLASFYCEVGRFDDALKVLRKAAVASPDNREVTTALAFALVQRADQLAADGWPLLNECQGLIDGINDIGAGTPLAAARAAAARVARQIERRKSDDELRDQEERRQEQEDALKRIRQDVTAEIENATKAGYELKLRELQASHALALAEVQNSTIVERGAAENAMVEAMAWRRERDDAVVEVGKLREEIAALKAVQHAENQAQIVAQNGASLDEAAAKEAKLASLSAELAATAQDFQLEQAAFVAEQKAKACLAEELRVVQIERAETVSRQAAALNETTVQLHDREQQLGQAQAEIAALRQQVERQTSASQPSAASAEASLEIQVAWQQIRNAQQELAQERENLTAQVQALGQTREDFAGAQDVDALRGELEQNRRDSEALRAELEQARRDQVAHNNDAALVRTLRVQLAEAKERLVAQNAPPAGSAPVAAKAANLREYLRQRTIIEKVLAGVVGVLAVLLMVVAIRAPATTNVGVAPEPPLVAAPLPIALPTPSVRPETHPHVESAGTQAKVVPAPDKPAVATPKSVTVTARPAAAPPVPKPAPPVPAPATGVKTAAPAPVAGAAHAAKPVHVNAEELEFQLGLLKKFLEQQNFQRVVAVGKEILDRDPRNVAAYRALAVAYTHLGSRDLSCESYRRYLRFAGNPPDRAQVEQLLHGCDTPR